MRIQIVSMAMAMFLAGCEVGDTELDPEQAEDELAQSIEDQGIPFSTCTNTQVWGFNPRGFDRGAFEFELYTTPWNKPNAHNFVYFPSCVPTFQSDWQSNYVVLESWCGLAGLYNGVTTFMQVLADGTANHWVCGP